jgi:hypothetical protein
MILLCILLGVCDLPRGIPMVHAGARSKNAGFVLQSSRTMVMGASTLYLFFPWPLKLFACEL